MPSQMPFQIIPPYARPVYVTPCSLGRDIILPGVIRVACSEVAMQ